MLYFNTNVGATLCPGERLRPEPGTPSGGASLRDAGYADDSPLPHLSPLGWEHINLMGDYDWRQNKQVKQGDFRPLPWTKERSPKC